jgi:rhodanese-related sulfurtransferase
MVKKKNYFSFNVVVFALVAGAIAGGLVSLIILNMQTHDQDYYINEFYSAETATHVSPHHIRKGMDKADNSFVLVDLRSQEEYEREHIIGAVNIPAYKSPDKSAYGDVERIVHSFKTLEEQYPGKELIVYCYSIPCMTGRKVGKMLAEHEVYVKHLGVGWNEWRYFWTMWNHEHEWEKTNVEDYVTSGLEPGVPELRDYSGCSVGEFGC